MNGGKRAIFNKKNEIAILFKAQWTRHVIKCLENFLLLLLYYLDALYAKQVALNTD